MSLQIFAFPKADFHEKNSQVYSFMHMSSYFCLHAFDQTAPLRQVDCSGSSPLVRPIKWGIFLSALP